MNGPNTLVTFAELGAALDGTAVALPALCAGLDTDDLLEIAAEQDERGPLETIHGLLEALRVRHAGDDVTLATLAAIGHLHLPMALDAAKG